MLWGLTEKILEAQRVLKSGGWKEPGEGCAFNPNFRGIHNSGVTSPQNLRTGKCLAWKDSLWSLSPPHNLLAASDTCLNTPRDGELPLQFVAAPALAGQLSLEECFLSQSRVARTSLRPLIVWRQRARPPGASSFQAGSMGQGWV